MAKTDFQTIDEYLATVPKEVRTRLEKIRQIIHKAVPDAKEVISYQIPCFKLNGPILYFSAYKNHIGIAAPPPTIDVFKDELKNYKKSKSVFQIPHDQAIPEKLVTKMAKYRESITTIN